jgi:hypothetical protein
MINVKFGLSKKNNKIIAEIVSKAVKVLPSDYDYEVIDLQMDLDACHNNGTPLDFDKLLKAPTFDFVHDVVGIRRHMCRKTGKLQDSFLPRCAKKVRA